jgi:hypothetical protein
VSLAIGALVTGALTPLVALAVALRAGGVPIAAVVTWSAVGFLAAGALAFVAGQVQMRVDLLDAGRRGDRARAAAARATRAGDVGAFAGVVVPALAFAAWVLLLSLLPALVVVLVPLHVVLVATARQAGGRAPRMGRGAAHQS